MQVAIKDPGSRIEQLFDWNAAYLGGRMLVASSWTVEPDRTEGLQIVAERFDARASAATVAGGEAGAQYRLTNRVTLSDGQIDERSLLIRVEQR